MLNHRLLKPARVSPGLAVTMIQMMFAAYTGE
jgi:hypothetical protein